MTHPRGQPQNLELACGNFPGLALYIRNEWLNLGMLPSYYAFKTPVASSRFLRPRVQSYMFYI